MIIMGQWTRVENNNEVFRHSEKHLIIIICTYIRIDNIYPKVKDLGI